MTRAEAIAEMRRWLAHLDEQRVRAEQLQTAAKLARAGSTEAAQVIRRRIDAKPVVYDGANLEPAVRWAIDELERRA